MDIIKNLFHVSLQEDSIEEALDFYCGKLGFELMFELKVEDFRKILSMEDSDRNNEISWLSYVRVAPEEYLEIFNGVINPPEFEPKKIDHAKAPVVHSFALGCEDPEKTIAVLEERGIPVRNGFITDPTGCRIRIVERKPERTAEKEHLFNSLVGVSVYVNDLAGMSEFLQKMGMRKAGETETAVKLLVGKDDQYLELLQAAEPVETGDEDLLGHIALQVNSVAEAVWTWGNNGVRCCMQPFMRDQPLEVKKGTVGNFAVDGCEIVWVVSSEGNRFEIMVQPGDTVQQKWEMEHPF